jgi:hypothetical protein
LVLDDATHPARLQWATGQPFENARPAAWGLYQDAIIANVLYFKGQWTTLFDPGDTTAATLHVERRRQSIRGADK